MSLSSTTLLFPSFIQSLENGEQICKLVNDIFLALGFDSLCNQLESLFVDFLGFTHLKQETFRFKHQNAFDRVMRIANVEGLEILAVESTHAGLPYPSTYAPLKQTYGNALIFVLGERYLRMFGLLDQDVFRTLRGRAHSSEPSESLALWTWRFSRLEPGLSESSRSYIERIRHELTRDAKAIMEEWSPEKGVTYPLWSEIPRLERQALLDDSEVEFSGLHRVLRNC